jgi:hypothetical protein
LVSKVHERAYLGNEGRILGRSRGKHFNLQHRGKTTPGLEGRKAARLRERAVA